VDVPAVQLGCENDTNSNSNAKDLEYHKSVFEMKLIFAHAAEADLG
jgi:hypothetical protein